MKLSNKVYDLMKWVLCIFVPAAITLIVTMGKMYGFSTELIVGTISAISTFAGAILGISCKEYNRRDPDTEE